MVIVTTVYMAYLVNLPWLPMVTTIVRVGAVPGLARAVYNYYH